MTAGVAAECVLATAAGLAVKLDQLGESARRLSARQQTAAGCGAMPLQ